jgi:O-antigen ligase
MRTVLNDSSESPEKMGGGDSRTPVVAQAAWVFTGLAVVFPVVSIFVAQLFLALAILSFIAARAKTGNWKLSFPPIKGPLILFMAYTVLALAFSPEPRIGLPPINKFWLFSIILLVANTLSTEQIQRTYRWLFGIGITAAALTIAQYFIASRISVENRLTGFMGHHMTLSGELMLVLLALLGYVLFARPTAKLGWLMGLAAIAVAIGMTLTRSVWIACLTGALILILMRRVHWLMVATMLAAVLVIGVVAPGMIQRRVTSMFDSSDPSNYARLAMWQTGLRMIQSHPWLGVGPQRISKTFYDYHPVPEDRNRLAFYPIHMHNNLLQFAAERGIPCALLWLWLMIKLAADHWQRFRQSSRSFASPGKASAAAIGFVSVLALFVAGLFEFNFGDSEVQMVFLFLVTAPYVSD